MRQVLVVPYGPDKGLLRDYGTTPAMGPMPMPMGDLPGTLEFPWSFPKAGQYRIWVQFRRAGAVRSAAFDVNVTAK